MTHSVIDVTLVFINSCFNAAVVITAAIDQDGVEHISMAINGDQ